MGDLMTKAVYYGTNEAFTNVEFDKTKTQEELYKIGNKSFLKEMVTFINEYEGIPDKIEEMDFIIMFFLKKVMQSYLFGGTDKFVISLFRNNEDKDFTERFRLNMGENYLIKDQLFSKKYMSRLKTNPKDNMPYSNVDKISDLVSFLKQRFFDNFKSVFETAHEYIGQKLVIKTNEEVDFEMPENFFPEEQMEDFVLGIILQSPGWLQAEIWNSTTRSLHDSIRYRLDGLKTEGIYNMYEPDTCNHLKKNLVYQWNYFG